MKRPNNVYVLVYHVQYIRYILYYFLLTHVKMCLKTVKIPCAFAPLSLMDGRKIRESCQGIQCIFDRDGHYPTPLRRVTYKEKRSLEKTVPYPTNL